MKPVYNSVRDSSVYHSVYRSVSNSVWVSVRNSMRSVPLWGMFLVWMASFEWTR